MYPISDITSSLETFRAAKCLQGVHSVGNRTMLEIGSATVINWSVSWGAPPCCSQNKITFQALKHLQEISIGLQGFIMVMSSSNMTRIRIHELHLFPGHIAWILLLRWVISNGNMFNICWLDTTLIELWPYVVELSPTYTSFILVYLPQLKIFFFCFKTTNKNTPNATLE